MRTNRAVLYMYQIHTRSAYIAKTCRPHIKHICKVCTDCIGGFSVCDFLEVIAPYEFLGSHRSWGRIVWGIYDWKKELQVAQDLYPRSYYHTPIQTGVIARSMATYCCSTTRLWDSNLTPVKKQSSNWEECVDIGGFENEFQKTWTVAGDRHSCKLITFKKYIQWQRVVCSAASFPPFSHEYIHTERGLKSLKTQSTR